MSENGFAEFLMGIPWFAWIVIVAIVCGSISQTIAQCQKHFERMAMIRHGFDPGRLSRKGTGVLRAGLIIFMVGLALTVGLYPIGFMIPANYLSIPFHAGPWLLPGLIPLGVGGALIISYYLAQDPPPSSPHRPSEDPPARD